MNPIERITRAIELEPNRYTRMSMNAVVRETIQKIERLRSKGEAR